MSGLLQIFLLIKIGFTKTELRKQWAKGGKYEDRGKLEGSKTQICPLFPATLVQIQQCRGLADKVQGN